MYYFLMVNSISNIISLSAIYYILYMVDFTNFNRDDTNNIFNEFIVMFGTFIYMCIIIFGIIWIILGSIIFWKYMDTSKCSSNVYNYLYTSLIIKLIMTGLSIFSKNRE
jgi:heme/copper-type cytochrome/quinol oxidase subunit 4